MSPKSQALNRILSSLQSNNEYFSKFSTQFHTLHCILKCRNIIMKLINHAF